MARGIDLPLLISPLDCAENLDKAIGLALEANNSGCFEKFVELANYYAEKDELSNWIAVIESVPKENIFFKPLNEELLNYYNTIDESSLDLLVKRFKQAYRAGLERECELYFSELAGEEDCFAPFVTLDSGRSDADLLAKIALTFRQKNEEIKTLRAELNPEKAKAPDQRFF